tara:strand:+ start:309 stop:488 length:180 start_codon:yes stop_codon:yes gene_type:complete
MKMLSGILSVIYGLGAFGTFNYIFFFSNHSFVDGPLMASASMTMFCSVGWPIYWLFQFI